MNYGADRQSLDRRNAGVRSYEECLDFVAAMPNTLTDPDPPLITESCIASSAETGH